MPKPKKKYYVVWKGKSPGVYDNWADCQKQIRGFNGAQYKSFKTEINARNAFKGEPADFIGKNTFESELSDQDLKRIGKPVPESLAVDAAFDGDVMEYKGVFTKTGKVIFSMGPFEAATNNIGEFLAIVHALGYLKKKKSSMPIYSDSLTALQWVKRKKANTKLKRSSENLSLFHLIERAEKWLEVNSVPNKLLKWETRAWGEIPADYGRK